MNRAQRPSRKAHTSISTAPVALLVFWTALGCGPSASRKPPANAADAAVEFELGADGTEDDADNPRPDASQRSDDDADSADAKMYDDAVQDAEGDQESACNGPWGCPCNEDKQCDSLYCSETSEGGVCDNWCMPTCDSGFFCGQLEDYRDGGVSGCFSQHASLCAPCARDADCFPAHFNGVKLASPYRCIRFGAQGSFCTSLYNLSCPEGYVSKPGLQTVSGDTVEGCYPEDGICRCSWWAVKHQNVTACVGPRSLGTCQGQRTCQQIGDLPTACDIPAPVTEVRVNGLDDDCDGQTDEN
jgi:hypothetical protein